MHIISVYSYKRVCACACASERVSARSRGVKTQKERETSGWRDRGRVEKRGRASAEKEKFSIEYTFRHPLMKRKLVVLGDVTVCCLNLADPGHIFSKFYC